MKIYHNLWKSGVQLGPRRIGFYRNRISTGNQNHHSVSGSPEPDFLKIRFRSGRTGFQNLTGFRPDFIIWLDYYRISKFSRIPTGIQKFWQCLSLEGGKEWDVSWFIEVTLTHKRISIRSLGGGGGKPWPIDPIKYYTEVCWPNNPPFFALLSVFLKAKGGRLPPLPPNMSMLCTFLGLSLGIRKLVWVGSYLNRITVFVF